MDGGVLFGRTLFGDRLFRVLDAHRLYLLPPPALRPGCPAGNICAEETFYTLDGFPISIFVPEAGCPVHDPDD